MTKAMDEFVDGVKVHDASFFFAWNAAAQETPEYQVEGFMPAASMKYNVDFVEYVKLHGVASTIAPVTLLAETFLAKWLGADGVVKVIEGYGGHWKVRDSQFASLKKDLLEPLPDRLYMYWDFQEWEGRINKLFP
jgi:hypothetical protein